MSYLICAMVVLAFLHFIYESILAPSFRLNLRCKLFALRDELRWLKIEHGKELNDRHFEYLHESINLTIHFLNRIDFGGLVASEHEYKTNPEFRKRVETRQKVLDDCQIKSARDLRRKSVAIAAEAFLVNSGALIVWLIPVVVPAVLCALVTSKIRAWFALKIKIWMAVPERDLERITPSWELAGLV
jgi:hypothetical protein